MPLETSVPTPVVKSVDTKGKSVCQVLSALDATDALNRAPNEAVQSMVQMFLDHGDAAVFLWGAKGMALLTILENPHDGRFAFFSWFQNDPSYTILEVLPIMKRWAENHGAMKIAAAIERGTPEGWEKLTGFTPWKMVIACDL